MNLIVYKITNKTNQKSYIGITTRALSQRWAEHCGASRKGSNKAIHKAIRKYGPENFLIESIDNSSKTLEELYQKEKEYIKQYNTFQSHQGYNCTDGGDYFIMTSEERLKRSKRLLGHKLSDETKRRISETKKQNPRIITDEYRQKISRTSTGRVFSAESIEKRAQKLRGQTRTKEQKQKMGAQNIGRKLTEDHKRKISQSGKNKTNKPFIMFKDDQNLGVFNNIRHFCTQYDLNDVSTSKILRGLIPSAKGYSGYRIDKNSNIYHASKINS